MFWRGRRFSFVKQDRNTPGSHHIKFTFLLGEGVNPLEADGKMLKLAATQFGLRHAPQIGSDNIFDERAHFVRQFAPSLIMLAAILLRILFRARQRFLALFLKSSSERSMRAMVISR